MPEIDPAALRVERQAAVVDVQRIGLAQQLSQAGEGRVEDAASFGGACSPGHCRLSRVRLLFVPERGNDGSNRHVTSAEARDAIHDARTARHAAIKGIHDARAAARREEKHDE